ncbi:esterase-like activity of phytase family protein [Oceanicola sp. 502str15]|uniref:esterase-like activity of phytase family protein n=1 Tax=Oceanicola sp. 502str15 TaxID=2696061 RepID=UPI00209411AA|nr:esterase-like activity of phytase family protein [Oceanicola sp. 502str15]MCO6383680.1 esterase-like activity of phytase family protein [Oceanicola sp. 502str15]
MRRRSKLGLTLTALALLSGLALAAGQGGGRVAAVSLGSSNAETRFGGFSGIEVSDDGTRFWALSDRAALAEGRLVRNGAGRLTGVEITGHSRLTDPDGHAVNGYESDAEGLARRADGRFYVSFEGYHRIWTWRGEDIMQGGEAAWLPRHPDFKTLQNNSALEALAISPDGALYTLPERSGSYSTPFPVYRYAEGAWAKVGAVERQGEWLPVGADFDDRGRLTLLWRHFTGYGFSSRITRHEMTGSIWPARVLYETNPLTHGNLEGLSLWRDADGQLRAVMVSDDNFKGYQRSEIVEVLLPD